MSIVLNNVNEINEYCNLSNLEKWFKYDPQIEDFEEKRKKLFARNLKVLFTLNDKAISQKSKTLYEIQCEILRIIKILLEYLYDDDDYCKQCDNSYKIEEKIINFKKNEKITFLDHPPMFNTNLSKFCKSYKLEEYEDLNKKIYNGIAKHYNHASDDYFPLNISIDNDLISMYGYLIYEEKFFLKKLKIENKNDNFLLSEDDIEVDYDENEDEIDFDNIGETRNLNSIYGIKSDASNNM
jgi:hypothetical protein